MTVTLHKYRETPRPFNQLGFDMTATDGSDGVGVLLSHVNKDTETVVTVSPAATGTTPTVLVDYSVSDYPERSQFIPLGSTLALTAESTIEVPSIARVLRFRTENSKAGGHVSIISSAELDSINTEQSITYTATPASPTVPVGATETIAFNSDFNNRLAKWELDIQTGSSRISTSDLEFPYNLQAACRVTRIASGSARIRLRARPFDGRSVVSLSVNIN